eukprot:TRINITY_DN98961_c0_g1_i1.p1 TRINITY_DN98961_c0_g1~~TRINITY_DN98961_c0_g1_i1.p1  ORF type:complete len:189 (-),score=35.59 TRINITY_DN98961_c0_g1_i1:127-693(-)
MPARQKSRSRSPARTRAGRCGDGRCGLRTMMRHFMFAASTVVARGATTGMTASATLAGAARPLADLVTDRLGLQAVATSQSVDHDKEAAQSIDPSDEDMKDDRRAPHWSEIAESRERKVRFQPPVIVKVESWKEETQKMNFRREKDQDDGLDMEEALDTLRNALIPRLASFAFVGTVAACVAFDVIQL